VDIAAPGVDIDTTFPRNTYDFFDGTSASAPVVAGLAGLLFSAHPDWTPREVAERITSTARAAKLDERPELKGRFGAGVVDFAAALSTSNP
jgi:subtilisin family serine protease